MPASDPGDVVRVVTPPPHPGSDRPRTSQPTPRPEARRPKGPLLMLPPNGRSRADPSLPVGLRPSRRASPNPSDSAPDYGSLHLGSEACRDSSTALERGSGAQPCVLPPSGSPQMRSHWGAALSWQSRQLEPVKFTTLAPPPRALIVVPAADAPREKNSQSWLAALNPAPLFTLASVGTS